MNSRAFTDEMVENAKPKDKPYRKYTGCGFYLLVMPKGSKLWRYDYRLNGKRKTGSLGVFPKVSVADAEEKYLEDKALISQDIDPVTKKRQDKEEAYATANASTFEGVARKWCSQETLPWVESTRRRILSQLERDVFPFIGKKPYATLKRQDYIDVLHRIEKRGVYSVARDVAKHCKRIARYAYAADIVQFDVTTRLHKYLTPVKVQPRASITDPVELGYLLRAIDNYDGELTTCAALRLLPYVFVQSAELRGMKWAELDLKEALWTIPSARMKMKRDHVVPLAKQSVDLLHSLQEYTGNDCFVFFSLLSSSRCISEQTLRSALLRMGYSKEKVSIYGFRKTASTLLEKLGFDRELIKMQLGYSKKNSIVTSCSEDYLPQRRKMMQFWADYLDSLCENPTDNFDSRFSADNVLEKFRKP